MSGEDNENNKSWDRLKNIVLAISFVTSVLALFLSVLETPEAISNFWARINNFLTPTRVQRLINIGNIGISIYFLLLFLLLIKISGKYVIKKEKEYDFCELAELERDVEGKTISEESQATLKRHQERVALLVSQYLWIICFFAISLVAVYFAIIWSSMHVPEDSSKFFEGDLRDPVGLAVKLGHSKDQLSVYLQGKLPDKEREELSKYDGANLKPGSLEEQSLEERLRKVFNQALEDKDLFNEDRFARVTLTKEIRGLIEQKPQGEDLRRLNRLLLEEAYRHEIANIREYRPITDFAKVMNLFNFLGGIIVFLAFWVLYSDTLNEAGKDNGFWVIPCVFAGMYTALFIYSSWLFRPSENAYLFLNRFDLFAGLINGLAMFLLFGRYVSLEQSLSKTVLYREAFKDLFKPLPVFKSESSYKKVVSFGIIFLLPIYALAQPQFGALQIPLYGDPIVFQTTVYATCLIGKICFFHLTYLLISKKVLHLYLYGLVAKVGNFKKLEECLTVGQQVPAQSHLTTQSNSQQLSPGQVEK